MQTIIVDLDEIKLFVYIHNGRKIVINYSNVGLNGKILINPGKGIFSYRSVYFFQYDFLFNKSNQYTITKSLVP